MQPFPQPSGWEAGRSRMGITPRALSLPSLLRDPSQSPPAAATGAGELGQSQPPSHTHHLSPPNLSSLAVLGRACSTKPSWSPESPLAWVCPQPPGSLGQLIHRAARRSRDEARSCAEQK